MPRVSEINSAAHPLFDRKPEITPENTTSQNTNTRSDFAIFLRRTPICAAAPVLNIASPTIPNPATIITFPLPKFFNTVLLSIIPAKYRLKQINAAVNGIGTLPLMKKYIPIIRTISTKSAGCIIEAIAIACRCGKESHFRHDRRIVCCVLEVFSKSHHAGCFVSVHLIGEFCTL